MLVLPSAVPVLVLVLILVSLLTFVLLLVLLLTLVLVLLLLLMLVLDVIEVEAPAALPAKQSIRTAVIGNLMVPPRPQASGVKEKGA